MIRTLFACPVCHHVSCDAFEQNWQMFNVELLEGCKGIILHVCPSCKHHGLKTDANQNPWEQILFPMGILEESSAATV